MGHQHPPRFLGIVDDAKKRVRETTVDAVKTRLDRATNFCWSTFARKANTRKITCRAQFIWAKA